MLCYVMLRYVTFEISKGKNNYIIIMISLIMICLGTFPALLSPWTFEISKGKSCELIVKLQGQIVRSCYVTNIITIKLTSTQLTGCSRSLGEVRLGEVRLSKMLRHPA